MKIRVTDWTDISRDSEPYIRETSERLLDGARIAVDISNISSSCETSLFSSEYFDGDQDIIYGEASTALDRSLQLAFSLLKDGDSADVEVLFDGKFVQKSLENSAVSFNCTVALNILTNGKEAYDMNSVEFFGLGKKCKEKGKALLTSEELQDYAYPVQISAFFLFSRSIKWFSLIDRKATTSNDEEICIFDEINILWRQCYNNLIFLHLAFNNYEKAIKMASVLIEDDASNIKALYRRSLANTHLQNYDLAKLDLESIIELEPNNRDALKQLCIVREKQKVIDDKLAKAMKKFIYS